MTMFSDKNNQSIVSGSSRRSSADKKTFVKGKKKNKTSLSMHQMEKNSFHQDSPYKQDISAIVSFAVTFSILPAPALKSVQP